MPSGHGPWGTERPTGEHRRAYADASTTPFWLDSPARPEAMPALTGDTECDLAIVGGGLSGLWAALLAKEDDPGLDVVLLEGERLAHAASGRNGGFLNYSLTHGIGNGMSRFPAEMAELERLGMENFDETLTALGRHGIQCDLVRAGEIEVALRPHEEKAIAEDAQLARRFGHDVELMAGGQLRAEIHSPIYRGGLWQRDGVATVDPAKLSWGLSTAAAGLGARIHERTRVRTLRRSNGGVELACGSGRIRAREALLATSAYPGLAPGVGRRVIPVYDYVLVSEPLSAPQMAAVGWERRQGISDAANQFHYYRLTADNRILWGGFDAIYNFGSRIGEALEQRDESFAGLARRFFITFPQLEGLRFTHRWGGAIDTCSRFFAFYGTAVDGRVAYAVGHTGLGVCASRFGARMALDLLAGGDTEATGLAAFRSRPVAFPPEPLRWCAIQLTRSRLAAADRRGGRRGLWLRALDRVGLGFDS